jgi:hypothetical protein
MAGRSAFTVLMVPSSKSGCFGCVLRVLLIILLLAKQMNTNIFAACLNSSLILQNVSQELARLCLASECTNVLVTSYY